MATSAFYGTFTGAPPEAGPGEVSGEVSARGNLGYVALWLLLYAASGALVLREIWRRGLDVRLALLAPFALYVVASATWAVNPWGSAVFGTMLALTIVVAAALAAEIHPAALLALMARTITALVAVSLALLVVDPASVVSTPDRPGLFMPGELYGVFSHKVALGTYAAVALLVLFSSPESFPRPWARRLSILVCAVGLVLSNSASAIVALVVAGTLLAAARLLPSARAGLFTATLAVVIVVSIALPFIDAGAFAQLLGRPPTLTGRTSFWTLAPDFILERPWLGYGYGGFFDQNPYSRVWDLWATAEWFFTPNFHNSALDVTIALGVVGLGAYLTVLLAAGAVHGNRGLGRSAELLAAVVVLFAVGCATDFQLMRHNALPTILMFYAFLVGGRRYAGVAPGRRG
jgi:O-antigen ligase